MGYPAPSFEVPHGARNRDACRPYEISGARGEAADRDVGVVAYNQVEMRTDQLPGGALVQQGLDDLAAARDSVAAWLVLVGAPRLRRLGLAVPPTDEPRAEHRLYERLAAIDPDAAHSRYNALIRLLVSFERAAACDG